MVPAAVVVAAAVWVIAVPIAGVDLDVTSGDTVRAIGLVSVIVVSAVISALAVGVRRLIRRLAGRRGGTGSGAWTVVASVVLVLSLLGPAAAIGAGALVTLLLLHLLVGGLLLVGLRSAPVPVERLAPVPTGTAAPRGHLERG